MSIRTRDIIGKAILETLETRQMMSSVTLADGVMVIQGNSNSANQIGIHTENNRVWAVTANGSSKRFDVATVRQIRIIGGEKSDSVDVDAGVKIPVYVQTGNGNDTIVSGAGNDTIRAGNGRDVVTTGAGSDSIRAGNGNDRITAGSGSDRIEAGNGSDVINDGQGGDIDKAGSGDD